MGTVERREREKQETRRKLLDAARDLFARHGFESVSMRQIAEAAEYSATAIYVHFKDKADLFHQLVRSDFAALDGNFARLRAIDDPIERIRQIGHQYIRFGVDYPNHYRLMFMTRHNHEATEEHVLQGAETCGHGDPDKDSYALLREAVAEALETGRFPAFKPGDVDLLSQTLWAGVHGVVSLHLTHSDDPHIDVIDVRQRAHAMVEVSLAGLLSLKRHGPLASEGAESRLAEIAQRPAAQRAARRKGGAR